MAQSDLGYTVFVILGEGFAEGMAGVGGEKESRGTSVLLAPSGWRMEWSLRWEQMQGKQDGI